MAKGSTAGTRSKTRPCRKDYTTKKGNTVYHRRHRYVRQKTKPYTQKPIRSRIGRRPRNSSYKPKPKPQGARSGGRIRYGPAAAPQGMRTGGLTRAEKHIEELMEETRRAARTPVN